MSIFLQKTDESFETARILVAPQEAGWGDVPYAKQPGPCGQESDYIHVTPGFISNTQTNRGKSV